MIDRLIEETCALRCFSGHEWLQLPLLLERIDLHDRHKS